MLEYSWGRMGTSGDSDYKLVDQSTGYLYYDFDQAYQIEQHFQNCLKQPSKFLSQKTKLIGDVNWTKTGQIYEVFYQIQNSGSNEILCDKDNTRFV